MKTQAGFTLVETIVVLTIVGVLMTFGVVAYSASQRNARDTIRITDAQKVKRALDAFYIDHGFYPNPGGAWRGECNHPWGTPNLAPNDVIPGLVPDYLDEFPHDPQMNRVFSGGRTPCYLYRSNGTDFAFLIHQKDIGGDDNYGKENSLLDTQRDGGTNVCRLDGSTFWSWKVASSGGRCW